MASAGLLQRKATGDFNDEKDKQRMLDEMEKEFERIIENPDAAKRLDSDV